MKQLILNPYDVHDRYEKFTSEDFSISECAQDMMRQEPFGKHPFYLFVHARTDDDGVSTRLIWQPRLTRPEPQSNSMLFKAYPQTDEIRICWMIPKEELFSQYDKDKLTEHDITAWSIYMFRNKFDELAAPEPDDLSEKEIDGIYKEISQEINNKKKYNVRLFE